MLRIEKKNGQTMTEINGGGDDILIEYLTLTLGLKNVFKNTTDEAKKYIVETLEKALYEDYDIKEEINNINEKVLTTVTFESQKGLLNKADDFFKSFKKVMDESVSDVASTFGVDSKTVEGKCKEAIMTCMIATAAITASTQELDEDELRAVIIEELTEGMEKEGYVKKQ